MTASITTTDSATEPTTTTTDHQRRRSLPARLRGSRSGRFAVFKVGRAVLVVMAATMLTQWLFDRAPGGVAATILGEQASPENVAALEAELGLDRSFFIRYFDWASDVVTGDLGQSPVSNRSVWDAITTALPITAQLVVMSTLIALALALATAFLAARRPSGIVDRVTGGLTSAALALPTFVLAPILLYFLAVRVNLFPVTGWEPLTEGVGSNLRSAILPAFAVSLPEFAVFQRLFRGDLVATLEEDYVDAARSRGIGEGRIMLRHAFRPASISLMTVTGISIGRLLGGTVVVESLFALPGIGLLLQQSIIQRDLIMVQGIVMFLAVTYVVMNLLVDVFYGVVDPRIRARVDR